MGMREWSDSFSCFAIVKQVEKMVFSFAKRLKKKKKKKKKKK